MGYFRFRKTFSIFPGVRINLSKTGVSGSLGGHGATVNVGKNGEQVTLGIPGTGLSYRTPLTSVSVYRVDSGRDRYWCALSRFANDSSHAAALVAAALVLIGACCRH